MPSLAAIIAECNCLDVSVILASLNVGQCCSNERLNRLFCKWGALCSDNSHLAYRLAFS